MLRNFLMLLFLSASFSSMAQQANSKLQGTVKNETGKTLQSATVQLFYSATHKMIKAEISGTNGSFEFIHLEKGKYTVQVSLTGYENYTSAEIDISTDVAEVPAIIMKPKSKTLEEVNIVSKKPFIEQKIDRMIVNVDASPSNSGATAMEVLEKSPNIMVDNNGNISLKGKQGVIVMLDGKPTYLSPSDLANLLKNMPAAAIDQIEIMTNPSSKYDASGNSGLINIKTRKNQVAGSNGNFSIGHTNGVFNHDGKDELTWKPSFSITYNNKKKKTNFFSNFIYNHREGRSALDLTTHYYRDNIKIDSVNNVSTYFKFRNNNFTVKSGLDFYADKKNTFGIVVNGFLFAGRPRPTTYTTFSDLGGNIFSRIDTKVFNQLNWYNYGINLNYKHTFDSTGREFTTDLDYAYYQNTSEQQLSTGFFNGSYQKTADSLYLLGHLPSGINIYSFKSDYVHPLKKGGRFEAGIKSSYVASDNLVSYVRESLGQWVPDSRNNHFIYNENINAAYLNFNQQIKKWSVQTGLRVENTNSKGYQVTNNSTVNHHYTNLFPSAFLSYEMDKNNQLTLSFSRRVQRPNYQDLNPFTFFLDSLSYRQGNPNLGPQFSYNYELAHTWMSKITTTINYTTTNKVISNIIRQQKGSNNEIITFLTIDNIAKLNNYGLSINAPVAVNKWWNASLSANVYNNHYIGNFVTTENNVPKSYDIDLSYTSFGFNINNSLTFSKTLTGEVSGWYHYKTLDQLNIADPMAQLNFGISKTGLMKGKGTLKIVARDPFSMQHYYAITRYGNIDQKIVNTWDTRNFGFTFTYRFGKGKSAQNKKQSGLQDEQNRVGVGQ